VLNADDFRVFAMRDLHDGRNVTYGIDVESDVMAKNIRFESFGKTSFTLRTPAGEAEVLFPLNGRHNISNALAAAAVGFSFGMTAAEIADSLKSVATPPNRGEILHFKQGFTVVNDTYNSNPRALVSMVKTLVEGGGRAARKVVVAGEMGEQGENAPQIHYEVGKEIAGLGIDKIYGVRGLAENLLEGARDNGLAVGDFYENSEIAAEKFIAEVRSGDLILIKGSRGVRTEKIVEKLLENFELEK
jgi:UDP-N-acetylmuramoyl-tripeptide--D-alanyl-D-alanine ligase